MSQREDIEQTIAAIEARRAALGDALTDAAIAPLRQHLAALDEQRKLVTVLFADMVGSTATAGSMDIEDMRDVMRAYFGRISAVITRHGGWIEKFIGDAVMSIFGIPTAHERDPERAIRAALEMHQALGELNDELEREQGIRLGMRIGINTGPVIVSHLGGRQGEDFAAIGQTINLAQRLEAAAPTGGIQISHATYQHVRGLFDMQPLPPLTVKGKHEPIQVYLVRGARPRTVEALERGVQGTHAPLIGRDAELAALAASLRAVRQQHAARVVTIVGDAGVGKSRLLEEFMTATDRESDNAWLFRGRAGQEPGRRPYVLLRDLLAYRFAIHDSDRAAEARQKLEQGMVGFMGPAGAELAPFIGHLIGFDYAASPQLHGIFDNARQLRDRALHALAALFAAVTEDHPALICLEDIHWADDSSLDAIEYLIRACEQLPVLFVALARPTLFERRPSWGADQLEHVRMQLRPLNEAESRDLAGALLRRIPNMPPALLDLVVGRAEGNPFYLEELITMLIEDGVIVADGDEWQVAPERLADARVPATLTGVLQARIDALPAGERATLQRASVIGRVFWDAAVARLGDRAAPNRPADPRATRDIASIMSTLSDLEALRAKGLTVAHPASAFSGTQEHMFKHALLHQVSYNSVVKRLRRQYHTQAGEWLIERSGERVGEYAALIAEHFELAGDADRAADWYARAAHQAQAIYAAGLAIEHYRKVLALLPSGGDLAVADAMRRAAAHEGLGEMLLWQDRYDEAAACYTDMCAAAELARDAVAQARASYGLAEVRVRQGDFVAALESAGLVERIAEAGGAHTELAMALLLQGWCLLQLGKPKAALGLGDAVLLLATEHDALREMARGLNLIGAIHKALGNIERAIASMRAGLELHRELGDRLRVVGTLNNLGLAAEELGDYRAAAAVYAEAVDHAREIKDPELELQSLGNLGGARVRLGDYQAGAADLRQALRLAETVGLAELARFYCRLAEADLGQDDPIGALVALQQAFELAQAFHDRAALGLAWRVLGTVLSQPSGRAAQRAAALALPLPDPDAEICFAESERIFEALAMPAELARTRYALARLRIERGDRARGEPLWHEVRATFARLGMRGDLAELEASRV